MKEANKKQADYIRKDCKDALGDAAALSELKDQTIYITGAGGFVGSWLLEMITCLNQDFDFNINVIAATRDWEFSKTNRPHLFADKNINFVESDVDNLTDIDDEAQFVIHLAGTPDNREVSSNPLSVVNTIVNGTNNVLSAASRLSGLQKFLFFSSGLVYGSQPEGVAQSDERQFYGSDCTKIGNSYAEAKRMAENICQIYRSQMRLPISIIRPFAFIGPYQLLERPWAINNFIRDAFYDKKINILGDAETVRSYMYPSDMAFWTLKYLINSKEGGTLNLGSSDGKSLRDVAGLVASNFSTNIEIETPIDSKDLPHTCFVPNTDRAKELYGLDINVNLEKSINKTIDWLRLE